MNFSIAMREYRIRPPSRTYEIFRVFRQRWRVLTLVRSRSHTSGPVIKKWLEPVIAISVSECVPDSLPSSGPSPATACGRIHWLDRADAGICRKFERHGQSHPSHMPLSAIAEAGASRRRRRVRMWEFLVPVQTFQESQSTGQYGRSRRGNIYAHEASALLDVALRHFLLFAQRLQSFANDHDTSGRK